MSASAEHLRRMSVAALAAATCLAAPATQAFTFNISPGQRMLYLQVGEGSITLIRFGGGAWVWSANNNTSRTSVTATLTAADVTSGSSVAMQASANETNSPYNGNRICPQSTDVFIGGLYRLRGNGTASLSVSPAGPLTAGTQTIPFSEIAWTSVGTGDTSPIITADQFPNSGSKHLANIPDGTWFEGCLRFHFRNTQPYPAGTFTGQAIYTLSAP